MPIEKVKFKVGDLIVTNKDYQSKYHSIEFGIVYEIEERPGKHNFPILVKLLKPDRIGNDFRIYRIT